MPTEKSLTGNGPTSCLLSQKSKLGALKPGNRYIPVGMGQLFCSGPVSPSVKWEEKATSRWWRNEAGQHMMTRPVLLAMC